MSNETNVNNQVGQTPIQEISAAQRAFNDQLYRWIGRLTISIGEGNFYETVRDMFEQVEDQGWNHGFEAGYDAGFTVKVERPSPVVQHAKTNRKVRNIVRKSVKKVAKKAKRTVVRSSKSSKKSKRS